MICIICCKPPNVHVWVTPEESKTWVLGTSLCQACMHRRESYGMTNLLNQVRVDPKRIRKLKVLERKASEQRLLAAPLSARKESTVQKSSRYTSVFGSFVVFASPAVPSRMPHIPGFKRYLSKKCIQPTQKHLGWPSSPSNIYTLTPPPPRGDSSLFRYILWENKLFLSWDVTLKGRWQYLHQKDRVHYNVVTCFVCYVSQRGSRTWAGEIWVQEPGQFLACASY